MTVLHNRVSNEVLKKLMLQEKEPRTTISFYQYFFIEDPQSFRNELYQKLQALQVFGRIYVAQEGINAQISVPNSNFDALRTCLYSYPDLNGIRLNTAVDDDGKSFWVLRMKVRAKIVADGITDASFNMHKKGNYVNAERFNQLTEDPNTIIVDMRNHYEYEIGHFENAIEIPSDTFREQLPMAVDLLQTEKDKNIIMYCTGGIRCEKASAWMLHNGFKQVYHLEGGVIEYAHQVKEKKLSNKFKGKNFVFDNRLGERISADIISTCHQCGKPCDTHTNCNNSACHLLFIQCTACAQKYDGCCSSSCATTYQLPAEEQKVLRKGVQNGIMVFNKSRHRKPIT